jgi:hypothetical protein
MRLCGARRRNGEPCREQALPGRLRCRRHGGLAGRPPGTPMHPNTADALKAGHERWLARTRLAKERGSIEKFPNGRRRRDAPKLSADKTVARAQRLMEKGVMAQRSPPAIPVAALPAEKPWEQQSKGERLSHNVDLSLSFTKSLLELPFDPENLKLLAIQKDAALTLISQQIRIESERLRGPRETVPTSLEEFYKGSS